MSDELIKDNALDQSDCRSISRRRGRDVVSRSMDSKQNGSYFQRWKKNKQNNDSKLRAWDIPGLNIEKLGGGLGRPARGKESGCIEMDVKNGPEVIRVRPKSKNLIVKTNPAFGENGK